MTDKFEFIDAEYAAYRESDDEHVPSIVQMCRWMEVSRSGFYEWRGAPESATAKRRGELALYVQKSFEDSDDTYGYRRVHADLAAWGVPAGPELVRSLMRELGLEPCQPRPWRVSLTEGDGRAHDIPDLVNRDFTADAPGEKMVGDISYISTWEGWLFLATVIDCHTKAVIGWAVDDNYKTPLIQQAIEMAARNYPLAENAIFHSDRGSNYTSCEFARTLKMHNLRQSVGRTGICYDNAMAESFFAALKNERVYRTQYPTREHARRDVLRYIEFWYNSKRRHSGLRVPDPAADSTTSIWNGSLQHKFRKSAVRKARGRSGPPPPPGGSPARVCRGFPGPAPHRQAPKTSSGEHRPRGHLPARQPAFRARTSPASGRRHTATFAGRRHPTPSVSPAVSPANTARPQPSN